MKKAKFATRPLFPRTWLVAWGIIYALILASNFTILCGQTNPTTELIGEVFKISSIALCLAYVLVYFRQDRLLQLAFLVTCIADIILTINSTLVAGVELFLVAQVIHLARQEWSRFEQPIIIVSLLAATTIILDCIFPIITPMYLVCFFYIIALVSNLFAAWSWCARLPQSPRALCCFVGFTLFLCCDICTGISYLSLNLILPTFLFAPANFFAWLFYYPSQVLLSNSSKLPDTLKATPPQIPNHKD